MNDQGPGTLADAFNLIGSVWNVLLGGLVGVLALGALYRAVTEPSLLALILAGLFALGAKWILKDSLQAFKPIGGNRSQPVREGDNDSG